MLTLVVWDGATDADYDGRSNFSFEFQEIFKKRQSRLQVSSHCPTRCVRPSAFLGAFHFWRQKQLQKAQQGCGVQANKPVSIVKYRSISLSQQLSLRSATKHRNRPLAEIFPKKTNSLICAPILFRVIRAARYAQESLDYSAAKNFIHSEIKRPNLGTRGPDVQTPQM